MVVLVLVVGKGLNGHSSLHLNGALPVAHIMLTLGVDALDTACIVVLDKVVDFLMFAGRGSQAGFRRLRCRAWRANNRAGTGGHSAGTRSARTWH